MANIKVEIDVYFIDGMAVTFTAPCDASADITGLTITCPKLDDGTVISKDFVLKDAHGNDVSGVDNLFASGALVKVILDTKRNYAFIQNADTNAYLEGRFNGKASCTIPITLSINNELGTLQVEWDDGVEEGSEE